MSPCFIHESSYVDQGVFVGGGTRVWHFCHIQQGARIGSDCVLGQNVNVGPDVRIGNGVKIQNNVSIFEGVELADYVFCGPSCVFTNDTVPRARYPKKEQGGAGSYRPTLVDTGATIGANATVICGHTIGAWAFIGAGAVVTADVPAYALVTGVPARRVGWVCECGEKLGEGLCCDACGRTYERAEDGLREVRL